MPMTPALISGPGAGAAAAHAEPAMLIKKRPVNILMPSSIGLTPRKINFNRRFFSGKRQASILSTPQFRFPPPDLIPESIGLLMQIADFDGVNRMWQSVEWVLELILSPAFHLICLMFIAIGLVGLLEWLLPAHDIPSQHYGLNLCYAVVNGVAIAAAMPFISAGTARVIQSVGFGLIDLRPSVSMASRVG